MPIQHRDNSLTFLNLFKPFGLRFWLMLGLFFTMLVSAPLHSAQGDNLAGTRPNIVLVMPDDVSYGTIGAYGGKFNSPHIDQHFHRSLRFSDFHVSPTCSPTRAAIMIGRHECYGGVTHTINMRDRLNLESRTIADMFKGAGYTTGIFGKWHLGDEAAYRPDQRGFDEVLIHGAGGIAQNYPHSADFPNNDYHNPVLYHNGTPIETQGYCTDIFFDNAISWMGKQQETDQRFFCYIPLNVAHTPDTPPNMPDGTTGDILANLDDNFGKLTAFLDESGLVDNTILVYMTDNGPRGNFKAQHLGFTGGKGSVFEGGTRVPFLIYWKGHIEGGIDCDRLVGHMDLYPTFAEIVGSDDPVPGDKIWDGRSMRSLLENPDADWAKRYWVSHKTRWPKAAGAQYKNGAIRDERYKIVFTKDDQGKLFDLQNDHGEKNDIAADHPEIVAILKETYDSWWADIQPFMVNDHLENVPKMVKPYHDLYREHFGQEKFDEAMQLMTWTGGKKYPPKGSKKKKK